MNPDSWEKQYKRKDILCLKSQQVVTERGKLPVGQYTRKNQNSYQKCDVENHVLQNGDIEIFSVMNFEGKWL
jgi:hypothetical protein